MYDHQWEKEHEFGGNKYMHFFISLLSMATILLCS